MLKQKIIHFSELNPSSVILIALLIPLISIEIFYFSWLLIFILLAVVFTFTAFSSHKLAYKILCWSIISCIVFQINTYFITSNWSSQFNNRTVRVDIQAVVTDPTAVGNSFQWLKNSKYMIMKVKKIRLSGTSKWHCDSEKIYVRLSSNQNIKYGDIIDMYGFLSSSAKNNQPNYFSGYLKSIKIDKVFTVKKVNRIIKNSTFPYNCLSYIFSIRNRAIKLSTSGFQNDSTKQFIAGLIFGCKQGINKKIKDHFLKTGTIHILAISGLHIGILALILLLIFRFIPIRLRYLTVPSLLFLYVIIIGYRPSAVRAFIMITIYALHKAFYLPVKALNVLSLAAVIMILINPFALLNIGFLYSFIIVGFLILSTNATNIIIKIFNETSFWKPKRIISFSNRLKYSFYTKAVLCISGSFIASLAAIPIQIVNNGLFTPFMPIINILIIPLLLPLFILIGLKLIINSFMNLYIINSAISGIIDFIFYLVNFSSLHIKYFYLQKPSLLIIIIFYILLTYILIKFTKKGTLTALVIILFLCFACGIYYSINRSKLIIYKPAGNSAVTFIVQSFNNSGYLINCPQFTSYKLIEYMKQYGLFSLNKVYLSKTTLNYSGGIFKLIDTFPVKKIVLDKTIRKNKLYKKLIKICRSKNINITYKKFIFTNYNSKDYRMSIGNNYLQFMVITIHPGLQDITIKFNNAEECKLKLRSSNKDKFITR
ncbi:MAG TPA: ComEC/Rec2 family competence protein [Victivallales bacterium]|nr:ComEC/Rec2 family competence protein [Victivallales bacterium]